VQAYDIRRANEETREAWNENAAFWDEHMGEGNDFVEMLIWPATVRLLQVQPGERILDVACGNGLTSRRLAAMGAEVVAFDFAQAQIEHARHRTTRHRERITYQTLDATDEAALLALGEGQYDAALCQMALFDMADMHPLVGALPRLLRPGGRFVFSVLHPCFNNLHMVHVAEMEDRAGELVTTNWVKIRGYITSCMGHVAAIAGQPKPQLSFHRPLQELLGIAFEVGFVLDGLEEPVFPPGYRSGRKLLSWESSSEIPPVLVARMRLPHE
jgi:2-polyprenyl-3-methyl-5-hydroxy-6-metoxy-1,4-benzoquinol methylase